ncbi:MAG TPA: isoprenyl transferase [Stellaceae bacterium]|nr:isoprenyl transferase [Stellaceae bacterium]
MPKHIAIIMDGNGRWAKARGLPRLLGHRQGVEAVRRTVSAALELGLPYLTLFGFSTENWKRSPAEVSRLMGLLRYFLRKEIAELHSEGVRLRIIGQRHRLPKEVVSLIDYAETLTSGNTRLIMTVALSYGGRDEIVQAARHIAKAAQNQELDADNIDESVFSQYLFTADVPDPDILIRTSGELRISNFLLWQTAYSELIFIDRLWPDFSQSDLEDAIREYHSRDRRFGATTVSNRR